MVDDHSAYPTVNALRLFPLSLNFHHGPEGLFESYSPGCMVVISLATSCNLDQRCNL
jgi:hypothetical protein